jgi:lactate racemase
LSAKVKGRSIESSGNAEKVAAVDGSMPTARMIPVPWGPGGTLELTIPDDGLFDHADVQVIWPDLSNPLVDYSQALQQAVDSPVGTAKLEEHVGPGTSVAIVVDDPSRWTPVREALPFVLQRLHAAGVGQEDITITVGVGRHHAVDAHDMRQRLGDSIPTQYRCFSPPVDDLSAYVDLGSTSQGIPVRIFRPVAEADLRILIGSVLPHLQAGFGGGFKLIFPGTSHRTTLGALHRQGLEGKSDPASLLGSAATENPMRQAIHAAAGRIGPCWSISHLIGSQSQVFRVVAGDPEQVQNLLARDVERRFHAPPSVPADLVIVGNNPWPGDPMQSFKVILQHRAACRSGGVLIGLFWTDSKEIDRSFPIFALRTIAVTGALGGWMIRRVLPVAERIASACGLPAGFMLRWACELVVDRTVFVYSPPLRHRLGPRLGPIHLFADEASLWHAADNALKRQSGLARHLRLAVFPQGGLTYAAESTTL